MENEKEVLQKYFSERGKHAVAGLWKKLNATERQERIAVPVYARKCKLYGKYTADQWLTTKFGEKRANELLAKPVFKRQWIKNL